MSEFTRVFVTPEGSEARVKVTEEGRLITYTLPDGVVHHCYSRDAAGKPECWWVNEMAVATL